ncbi:MAG: nucleotidyltransferase domain-containing protein [Methanoregulaceae archaeon]|nr:nucleotidyltransferase domain-containing protein [Methanoregulaceae archaeon]
METVDLIDFVKKELKGKRFIFYTLSGAHLYGFPSVDSDYDIRGCHIMNAREVCGLRPPKDFIEKTDGDIDFVSFDIKKELNLVVKNNSNVLEHIFALPLVEENAFTDLKNIADMALSKTVFDSYHGLAMHNWKKYILTKNSAYEKSSVKKYLYVLRSQMAGIYALEHGRIEPDIRVLNRYFSYSVVDELIDSKTGGSEKMLIQSVEEANKLIAKLWTDLDASKENSNLPDHPPEKVYEAANNFLLECREL